MEMELKKFQYKNETSIFIISHLMWWIYKLFKSYFAFCHSKHSHCFHNIFFLDKFAWIRVAWFLKYVILPLVTLFWAMPFRRATPWTHDINWMCISLLNVLYTFNLRSVWPGWSSRPGVFCKKRVLKNLAKFTGKQLC